MTDAGEEAIDRMTLPLACMALALRALSHAARSRITRAAAPLLPRAAAQRARIPPLLRAHTGDRHDRDINQALRGIKWYDL